MHSRSPRFTLIQNLIELYKTKARSESRTSGVILDVSVR